MHRLSRHFWKQDWGAVLLALLICTVAWAATDRFARLERQWYDLMVAATPVTPSPDLVVVGIDDASVAELGPWPWSRDLHARLIDTLSLAGARLVVLDVPTAGAEGEQALAQLQRISGAVTDDPELAAHPRLPGLLLQAQEVLDADAHLAASLAHSQHVLLAVTPTRPPASATSAAAPEPVVPWPLAALGAAALGIGHDEWQPEADGRVRTLAPTLDVSGRHIASLALWVLAQQQATGIGTLQVRPIRRELTLGATRLPLDHQGLLRPPLIDPLRAGIVHHSARDVLAGRVPAKALAGKIVLIGPTSAALVPQLRLPDDSRAAPVSVLALATAAVLSGQLIAQPVWVDTLAWLLLCGVAVHLVMLAPRLARVSSLAVSSLFGTALLVCAHVALTQTQTWLTLMLPLLALLG
ncbi:MAG: CHASE2 domain-containing protein, partial [Leptothrix sp. (in: b-proteobacteria)]